LTSLAPGQRAKRNESATDAVRADFKIPDLEQNGIH